MIKYTVLNRIKNRIFFIMSRFSYLCLLVLLLAPYVVYSQGTTEEVSLEKKEDSNANIKRFDLVNYQIIADQKYYKNNPEEQNKSVQSALDEQLISGKSAEEAADAKKTSHEEKAYDQRTTEVLDEQTALDTKLLVSAEEKTGSKQVTLEVDDTRASLKSEDNASEKGITNTNELTKEAFEVEKTLPEQELVIVKEVDNVKPVEVKQANLEQLPVAIKEVPKSEEIKINTEVTSNESAVSSSLASDSLSPAITKNDSVKVATAKPTTYPSTIEFKDNNSVVPTEKHVPAPKKVEPTPVTVEPTPTIVSPTPISEVTETPTKKPEINREKQVIDGLINSGNYEVYDDGKYIKISRKKNNK